MANGTYNIPRPLKDEDKWLKFFTKTQLLIVGIGIIIAALFGLILWPIGANHIAVVIAVIIIALSAVLAFFPMPPDKYLYGGGYPLYIIALRVVVKMFSKKKIYIKNYDMGAGGDEL